jgi:hypothetical protein
LDQSAHDVLSSLRFFVASSPGDLMVDAGGALKYDRLTAGAWRLRTDEARASRRAEESEPDVSE